MATNVQKPNSTTEGQHSLANEIVSIALLAISVLLLLCLFTYNSQDPSLNSVSRETTQNFVGSIGANIAAILFQAIGLTAFAVPFLLLLAAWRTFWAESLYLSFSRFVGFVLLVICLPSLLPLLGFVAFFDGSVPAGGLVGTFVSRFLASGLGVVGSSVLLIAIAAVSFLLVTGFSYAPLVLQLKIWYDAVIEKFRAWRERERERARLRFENRRQAREKISADLTQKNEPKAEILLQSNGEAAVAQTNFFTAATRSVKNFLQRIRKPPDFAADEKNADEISETDETVQAPDVKIKPPRVGREEFSSSDDKIEDEIVADDEDLIEDEDEFPSEIPIQPLKSGDAVDSQQSAVSSQQQNDNSNSPDDYSKLIENPPSVFVPYANYELPTTDFLNAPPARIHHADNELLEIAKTLEAKCQEFKAAGKVVNICPGPVVTTYEYKLSTGIQFKTISNLVDDLCLGLQAESVRIDRIPGKAYVGVEVPNPRRETIFLREVLEARAFRESQSLLTIALGKTVDGLNYVADLAKMPHLLIAGATGAGKSVGVNSLIVSILYKARPDEVKFIMVDPKQVELNLYEDIPHLAAPIITDPKRAAIALKWAVAEMERRYKTLSGWFVRNIEGYNAEVHRRNLAEEFDENGEAWKPLPYIVIIVDEFADLMITSRAEVEESIMRLVAKARAVGIHLILATQRPSVDVVTGVIKANFPCRVAFRVSSAIDSKTIINHGGAEHLLGRGDMLFLPPGASKLVRVHGAFVEESEIGKIVAHIKLQGSPEYDTSITQTEEEAENLGLEDEEQDELFEQALRICVEMKRASTSVLQRRLSIGYGRAAKIIDAMERAGYVGQADGASKPRPILGKAYERIAEMDAMRS